MKQITVISGKGGTGKTTLVGSFAALAENKVIADCDVDAPDLHLLLHPEIIKREEFKGLKKILVGFSWEGWAGHNWSLENKICLDLHKNGDIFIL